MSEPSWRSLLYVPAHQPKKVKGAHKRGADVIILDLEDGVPAEAKAAARAALKDAVPRVKASGAAALVRINKPWGLAWRDLEAALAAGADALLVPKVEDACQLSVVSAYLDELGESGAATVTLLALVESARGLNQVKEIAAASHRLRALIPGNEDLATVLGIGLDPERMVQVQLPILLAARAEGLSVYGTLGGNAGFRDLEGYKKRVELSKEWGFDGSTCIHPAQVAVVNDVYQADESEVREAQSVVAIFEAGGGSPVALDGRMVDRPVYLRAKHLLEQAGLSEGP